MTPHHLAIAMEYAPGGDLSEYVDACKRAGVCFPQHASIAHITTGQLAHITSSTMTDLQHNEPASPRSSSCVWIFSLRQGV